MNATEQKKLSNIKKKLKCDLANCIDSLSFEILDTQLKFGDKDKVKYIGRCSKCGVSSNFTRKNIELIEKYIGKATVIERKCNFDSLFDTDE